VRDRDVPREPESDRVRFGAANHRHLTAREVRDGGVGIGIGWRVWCPACRLAGEQVYTRPDLAQRTANDLRSQSDPPCRPQAVDSPAP
jgi:hypothetical protein